MGWPAYVETWRSGELARRARTAIARLADCTVCPRDCHVNRLGGETHHCGVGRHARVASAFAHLGEEDCLRGWRGSGTIFFGGCNLRCVFCQNWETSHESAGEEVEAAELARLMLELQDAGCHNVNLVTPEHVVPQLLEALVLAAERGLRLPLVYNTSAYDALESLALLDGVVDVYMPDLKLLDPRRSASLLGAKDYPDRARAAIREMHRQVGPLELDEDGLARRGVLVRHLVMPGCLDDSAEVFRWLAGEVSADTYVNVMDQYHPDGLVARQPERWPALARPLSQRDARAALELARGAGLGRLDERGAHPRLRARTRHLAVLG